MKQMKKKAIVYVSCTLLAAFGLTAGQVLTAEAHQGRMGHHSEQSYRSGCRRNTAGNTQNNCVGQSNCQRQNRNECLYHTDGHTHHTNDEKASGWCGEDQCRYYLNEDGTWEVK